MTSGADKLGWRAVAAFGSGDFAFNLYWQSLSLYLLFYYTDVVGLPASVAGFVYMVGSIWDGLVDPLIGALADRSRSRWGRYRPFLLFGSVPLAGAFMLLYYKPPLSGSALVAAVLGFHILFRSLYALVNVPYAALTARLTRSASERANLAGARMIFATLGGTFVALATQPVVAWSQGSAGPSHGFLAAALLFAIIATPVILLVFATTHEPEANEEQTQRLSWRMAFVAIRPNRAFWSLVAGGSLMVIGNTALIKSVLYFFKYVLHDEAAARTGLALASASGLIFVPFWMIVSRSIAKRTLWLVACGIFAMGIAAFAIIGIDTAALMWAYLVYMQLAIAGLAFAYWAMLPDTVEYGELRSGVRAEAFLFGLALLFQKISLGLGAGLLGLALDYVGYRANLPQPPATLDGIRAIMIILPLGGVALSGLAIVFNPLRRGVHEAIVDDLTNRTSARQSSATPSNETPL